jgi:membrane protein implicated in regulation of membrane protease activity
MVLVAAIVLAIFVLPAPWGIVAVAGALLVEAGEAWFWWRLSRRRRPAVGVETLVGARATVVSPCRPTGQVRVAGELWRAVCSQGADPGDSVRVVAVDGLALIVAR